MFLHARLLPGLLALGMIFSCCSRAETAAELLDPNAPPPRPAPILPVTPTGPGTVDEPGFKASTKSSNRSESDFDPLAAKGIGGPKRAPGWSVPQEEGVGAPGKISVDGGAADDKNSKAVEAISPALAGAIAREKAGVPVLEMLPVYKAIAASEPGSAAAQYRLGLAHLRLKDLQKGLVSLEAAIVLDPRNTKYLCDYGIAALQAGWVEKAYAACNAAVMIAPNNPRYLSALADVHLAGGHTSEAAEVYARALKSDPQNSNLYYNLGLVYMHARAYKRAAEIFSEALRIKPNTSMYLCSRGLAYENLKSFKLAIQDYSAAIKADDKNAYAYYLCAGIFSDPEDPTYTNRFEALEHSQKAVKLTNGKNAQYLMGLARALRVNRNYEDAVEAAKRAVDLEPGRSDFRLEWQKYARLKSQGVD